MGQGSVGWQARYRDQTPFYFWFMVAVYTALGVLLIAGC